MVFLALFAAGMSLIADGPVMLGGHATIVILICWTSLLSRPKPALITRH